MMKLINTDLDAGALPSAETAAFWQTWLSTDSTFCRALVSCGYLSEEQMQRAADRYRLGRSRDGGVIFWQIDQEGHTRDGKIMYYRDDCHRDKSRHPDWTSARMKAHYGYGGDLPVERCLFGLHLLFEEGGGRNEEGDYSKHYKWTPADDSTCTNPAARNISPSSLLTPPSSKNIAVVESEKTAVIMSEVRPDCIWMATGGKTELTVAKLKPLQGRRVILFPDTDTDGTAYREWYELAEAAGDVFGQPFTVSSFLEQQATPSQKQRKIDIADFFFGK